MPMAEYWNCIPIDEVCVLRTSLAFTAAAFAASSTEVRREGAKKEGRKEPWPCKAASD